MEAVTAKSIVTIEGKAKISSVLAYSDRMIVALSNGHLQLYFLTDPLQESIEARLHVVYKSFSTRPIDKMAFLKNISMIAALSEGTVKLYDIDTFEATEVLEKCNGNATHFDTWEEVEDNKEPDGFACMFIKIAIACKRRLVCYKWKDQDFEGVQIISLPDRVKSVHFLNSTRVVCIMSSEFAIVDLNSGTIITTQTPGASNQAPAQSSYMGISSYIGIGGSKLLACRSANSTALLSKDSYASLVDEDGELIDDNTQTLDWSSSQSTIPEGLAFMNPYILCVHPKSVELRSPVTLTTLQVLNDMADIKYWSTQKLTVLATSKQIFKITFRPFEQVIESLSECQSIPNRLSEAVELANTINKIQLEDKERIMRALQIRKARDLYENGDYSEAFWLYADVSAPPLDVLNLFPNNFEDAPNQAVRGLQGFLADSRRKLSALMDGNGDHKAVTFMGVSIEAAEIYGHDLAEAATLVDTALFKCYLQTSPGLIGALVRVHNNCDSRVVKDGLLRTGRVSELVDFYYGKKDHQAALKLLVETTNNDNQAGESIDGLSKGPSSVVKYLQRLDNQYIDLILQYAEEPVKSNPDFGRDLFIEDTVESEGLDKEKVYALLERIAPEVAIEYLVHIISKGNEEEKFHNALAFLYIKKAMVSSLVKFLRVSKAYNVERVLRRLPQKNDFLEARAVLFGRKRKYADALKIFAFEMGDFVLASQFCSEIYDADEDTGRDVLHILLLLYLKSKDNFSIAFELIKKQGSRMNPLTVIENLPEETSLEIVSSFLIVQIRKLSAQLNAGQMDTALRKVELVKTQEDLMTLQRHSTTITSFKTCKFCMKRLGQSVVSVFPDGTVVHYGCADAYEKQIKEQQEQKRPHVASDYMKHHHSLLS